MTDPYRPVTAIYYDGVAIASDLRESDPDLAEAPRMIGNLMSVLTPATPPEPRNARLICRMGLLTPKRRVRTTPAAGVSVKPPPSDDAQESMGDGGGASKLTRRTSLLLAARLDLPST